MEENARRMEQQVDKDDVRQRLLLGRGKRALRKPFFEALGQFRDGINRGGLVACREPDISLVGQWVIIRSHSREDGSDSLAESHGPVKRCRPQASGSVHD